MIVTTNDTVAAGTGKTVVLTPGRNFRELVMTI